MMNDLTLYCVTIVGVKKKDFQNLKELMVQYLRESLIAEEIDYKLITTYLENGNEIILTNTNNRSIGLFERGYSKHTI